MPGGPSKDRCEDRASRSRVRPNSGEGAVVVLVLWKYRQRQRGQRQEQSLGNPRIQRFDPAVSRVRLRLQRTNFEAHHIATPRAIIPTDPQRRGTEAHKALQEAAPSSNFYGSPPSKLLTRGQQSRIFAVKAGCAQKWARPGTRKIRVAQGLRVCYETLGRGR